MVVLDDFNSEITTEQFLNLPPFSWAVRPCEQYKEEYKDCRSIKERFHQYFIHGETYDCSQWKEDYNSCMKYREKGDKEALAEVIESEKERRQRRLEGHLANDVWEKREAPPPSWNDKLPESKDQPLSYLGEMQDKQTTETVSMQESSQSCVVL